MFPLAGDEQGRADRVQLGLRDRGRVALQPRPPEGGRRGRCATPLPGRPARSGRRNRLCERCVDDRRDEGDRGKDERIDPPWKDARPVDHDAVEDLRVAVEQRQRHRAAVREADDVRATRRDAGTDELRDEVCRLARARWAQVGCCARSRGGPAPGSETRSPADPCGRATSAALGPPPWMNTTAGEPGVPDSWTYTSRRRAARVGRFRWRPWSGSCRRRRHGGRVRGRRAASTGATARKSATAASVSAGRSDCGL